MKNIQVVEVCPRDGFQLIEKKIPTDIKISLINKMIAAGVKRMEVGSFVSSAAVPQMADIRDILVALPKHVDFLPFVLVPNLRGAEFAIEADAKNLVIVISATQSHNQENIRRSIDQSLSEISKILEICHQDSLVRIDIATSFHCPFEGVADSASVLRIIGDILNVRPDVEICLCDTIGKAMPHEVSSLFLKCMEAFPGYSNWAFHAHDTYGYGIANVLSALEVGVEVFDASVTGLGGCPFAPGSSGNISTEDVLYTFSRLGIDTGIDFDQMLEAGNIVAGFEAGGSTSHLRRLICKPPNK